jgi:hypothetical protein
MRVELLYFDGCPNYESLLGRLRRLLDSASLSAKVELRRVESDDDARALRFLGSPTVRVDGRDVEPGAEERHDYGLKCRLYRTPDRVDGVPSDKWLREALGVSRTVAPR